MDIDEDKGGLVEEGEFKSYCKRKGSLTQILIPRKSLFQALKRGFRGKNQICAILAGI